VRATVSDYLANRVTAADLDRSIGEMLYAAADRSDTDAVAAASTVALRLSEFWDGAWSEHELRQHLEHVAEVIVITRTVRSREFGSAPLEYSTSATGAAQTLLARACV